MREECGILFWCTLSKSPAWSPKRHISVKHTATKTGFVKHAVSMTTASSFYGRFFFLFSIKSSLKCHPYRTVPILNNVSQRSAFVPNQSIDPSANQMAAGRGRHSCRFRSKASDNFGGQGLRRKERKRWKRRVNRKEEEEEEKKEEEEAKDKEKEYEEEKEED